MAKKILKASLVVIIFSFILRAQISNISTAATTDFSNFDFKEYLSKPRLALTFDDGPHPVYTNAILKILEQEGAKATFFVVGKQVKIFPELLLEIAHSGNEIGNHTYHHYNLAQLDAGQVNYEIKTNEELIQRITGLTPRYFRPPGGHYNYNVVEVARENGEDMALWSIHTNDTARPTSEYICRRVLQNVEDRSVILLHSGVPQTLAALPGLIRELKKKGFRLVTLSELDKGGESS
ncbi:MAG: polysaccharide deacetylase family protein [Elusimicrobia bacterium]|nr:polysaccharide deacetylase family protein [Elusimicrobiota bacterium]